MNQLFPVFCFVELVAVLSGLLALTDGGGADADCLVLNEGYTCVVIQLDGRLSADESTKPSVKDLGLFRQFQSHARGRSIGHA